MCDCPEIRTEFKMNAKYDDGCSFFAQKHQGEYQINVRGFIREDVWLPRQDQLQEMMNESKFILIERFYKFVNDNIPFCREKSMEQLWLVFVMKEKFNKMWNGKQWN